MNPIIDPTAYEPVDELVVGQDYNPLAGDDAQPGMPTDPLAVLNAEREAAPDEEDVLPYVGNPDENHLPETVVDGRPAEVRTAELFERMKPRRKVLLGVIDLCREPAEVSAVNERVEELQAAQRSVYDGPALTALLERAGAIERLRETEPQEPKTVVVDGVEYLEPAEKMVVRYRSTPVGLAMLQADRPAERLDAALEKDAVYKPIFLRILKACGEEGGKSAKELGALVDSDPLLQSPRFWAAHFFNILSECDALIWNGTWQTTELGWQAVEALELEGIEA